MKIHLVLPGRNTATSVHACLTSVCKQTNVAMRVTWIDDASDDGSFERAKEFERECSIDFVRNTERRGGLRNIVTHAQASSDDEIVVIMGADDEMSDGALARLATELEDPECWVAYSRFRFRDPAMTVKSPSGAYGPEPFRDQGFLCHGVIAWRAPLLKKLEDADFMIGGHWQPSAGDNALLFPMLELAGHDRVRFVDEPLLVYNFHEGSDFSTEGGAALQAFCAWYCRFHRPRYARLSSMSDRPVREKQTWGEFRPACVFVAGVSEAQHTRVRTIGR